MQSSSGGSGTRGGGVMRLGELEKMNKKDQTSLLNLMESGILSELKHKQQRTTQLKTWIFASCCFPLGLILKPICRLLPCSMII
jgi:hypothetical protein